jgi:methyl-accepting chemotaxis protein
MEELTAAVRQNAENASEASADAGKASDTAGRSSDVVDRVVDTTDALEQRAAKIADITTIIEGIAFQTNILAFNAAVESARAGTHGRGFAVVANEVRSLAQRCSNAAKETTALVNASVDTVQKGSALAREAGGTMREVTLSANRVASIMKEIADASNEQSRGIAQVNLAITQMDDVTQQNATLVEQAAAASRSLEDQGHALSRSVKFLFDIYVSLRRSSRARPWTTTLPTARGCGQPPDGGSVVDHRLPASFAFGLTRRCAACPNQIKEQDLDLT